MSRKRRLPRVMRGYLAGMHVVAQGWPCQLLHAERRHEGVLLDLIALELCPFPGVELTAGSPFVIRVVNEHADSCAGLVEQWADAGEILDIRIVANDDLRWLCISSGERHILLEVC